MHYSTNLRRKRWLHCKCALSTFIIITFPDLLVQEARRHGKSLEVEVVEGKDGSPGFIFSGIPGRELQDGVTDVEQRLETMDKGRIAIAALDPTTLLVAVSCLP